MVKIKCLTKILKCDGLAVEKAKGGAGQNWRTRSTNTGFISVPDSPD
jgi:hypothetical protein